MAKIRASRSGGLIQHSGLLAVARSHSMSMSRSGGMNHNNADSRIRNAPPDPFESNGAPDDGVPPAKWCENVTYSTGHPASEVADRLYSQWQGSGAHARCMRDTSRNVGAVGVYYDGSTWWATFIANVDNTPPGSGGGAPAKTAAPKPSPAAVDDPAPATTSAPRPAATASSTGGTTGTPAEATTSGARSVGRSIDQVQPQASALPEDDSAAGSAAGTGVTEPPALAAAGPLSTSVTTDAEPFRPASSVGYGWQELSALAGVLFIASLLLRRRSRPVPRLDAFEHFARLELPAEVERRDHVPLPEVELVGAGAPNA